MSDIDVKVSDDVRLNGFADTFKILESVTDGFIALDREWNFVYLNAEAARTLGRTGADLRGKNLWTEFPELKETPFGQLYLRAVRENRVLSLEGYYPPFDAWFNARAYPNENGLTIFFINVTEQKRAAEKLRESEELLQGTINALTGHIAVLDKNGVIVKVNETWRKFAEENLFQGVNYGIGQNYIEACIPNDKEPGECDPHGLEAAEGIRKVANGELNMFELEYPCHSPNEQRWFVMRVTRFNESSEDLRVVVAHENITARKLAEERLQRNHETFFNLVQNAPFGIYVVDGNFRLVQISIGSQKVFSNIDPLIGRDFAEILRTVWEEPFAAEAIHHFRHTLATGEPYWARNTTEKRGNIEDVESYDWKIERVVLPDGSFGVVCYFYDLTEQRRIEQALRESDARLRLAIDISRTSTFDIDLLTNAVQTDAIGREIYGFEADEPLTFDKIQSHFHPEDRAEVMRRVSAAFAPTGSDEFEVEQRIIRTNGETRWIRVRGRAFFESEGETRRAVRCLGTYIDITDSKLAEQALRESEARFRNMADHAPVMVWITEPDGTCTYLSQSWYNFTGQTPETGFGFGWLEATHPDDAAEAGQIFLAANERREPFRLEYRLRRKDGSYAWAIDSAQPRFAENGEFLGYIGSVIDITERKQAEEDLRETQKFTQAIIESVPTLVYIYDFNEQRNVYVSPQISNILGYTPKDLREYGTNLLTEVFNPDDLERIIAHHNHIQSSSQNGVFSLQYRMKHRDGEWRWINSRDVVFKRDENGSPTQILGTAEDITERKQAEEALRESENQVRVVTDALPVLISYIDAEQRYRFVNQRYTEWFKLPQEKIIGKHIREVIGEDVFATVEPVMKRVLSGEEIEFEQLLHYNIGDKYVHVNYIPHFDAETGEVKGYYALVQDISERKKSEQALRESRTQLDLALQVGRAGTFEWNIKENVNIWSPEIEELYGIPAGTFEGNFEAWANRVVQEDVAKIREGIETSLKMHLDEYIYEFRAVLPDGSHRWLEGRARFEYDENSEPLRMFGINVDITDRKRAEEAVRESSEFNQGVLDSLLAHIAVLDKNGTITTVNQAWRRFAVENGADWTMRGVGIGTNYLQVCRDVEGDDCDDAKAIYQGINDVLEGRRDFYSLEYPCHSPTQKRWFLLAVSPLSRTTDGGVVISHLNITARKLAEEALRESEARFRNVSDSAPVLIWLNGLEGCEYVNRQYLDFIGVDEINDVRGFDWAQFIHPDDKEYYVNGYLRVLEKGEKFVSQFRFRRHDGEYRWMTTTGLPRFSASGELLGYVGSTLDINDIKEAEEALREADRRKDEFLATLAHELRNPLAPIQTALEIMHSGESKEKGQEAREIIERQVKQLTHLVDDLLDISRITQGKIILKKSRIDLRDALNAALEASRPSIDDNQHDLTVSLPDEPVFIDGDMTRLAQVFLNLLNNAAKFTNRGGKISISAATENGNAVVRVRDNGLGIPPEMLERVFEMFSQVERNGTRPQTGLGIGLNLVKRLVEKHGGTVVAESAGVNAGSDFVVHLPLAAEQTPLLNNEAENAAPSAGQSRRLRILVVDDNVDAADMLQFALELDKHQVATAYDALSALTLADDFQPEVCLLDIGLPDIDGYELARRLREKMPKVLLIALSGWGQDEDRRRSAEAGFNHHLVKPIKLDDIYKLLI